MNAEKVLADTEHSYVQRRRGCRHEKGFGEHPDMQWKFVGSTVDGGGDVFFFIFKCIFIFRRGGGWGLFRGFTVPTDSGVGHHRKVKSYGRTYTGVIVAFFQRENKQNWKFGGGGVRENLRLTLKMKKRQQEKQTRRNISPMYRCTFFTRESTRLPRSFLR